MVGMAEAKRKLAAIFAADVAGYSRLMGDDERATVDMLNVCREVFKQHIDTGDGRVVDTAGDSLLAVFQSAVEAVQCAIDVQAALIERNSELPEDRRMLFRVGVNLGDIIEQKDGTIYGDGVNVAARLESLAEPGGICISSNVHDFVENKIASTFEDIGEQEVKNIARPVRTYRISTGASPAETTDGGKHLKLPSKPSIAILPFDNLSGDQAQDYFADGISEDLITALSRIRWLFVIARNSTFAYKDQSPDVRQVGRELGVRYVLEGSVRRGANRVRINAQLIDATTGNHVWAERYDRALSDLFDLQDEITETITGAIEPELSAFERDRTRGRPPESLDAWENAQRGFGHLWQFDKSENAKAKQMFQRAIELDPGLGPAHSGLSYSHLLDASLAFTDKRAEALAAVARFAQKAIALDNRDTLAHTALGRAYVYTGDMASGIAQLENAIELNPSFALAHFGLGQTLAWLGRAEEAVAALDKAIRLSPHDPYLWLWEQNKALALSLSGNDADALVWARRATRHLTSGFPAFLFLAMVLGHMEKHHDEARDALAKLLDLNPRFSVAWLQDYLHFAEQTVIDHIVKGMRQAGLENGA